MSPSSAPRLLRRCEGERRMPPRRPAEIISCPFRPRIVAINRFFGACTKRRLEEGPADARDRISSGSAALRLAKERLTRFDKTHRCGISLWQSGGKRFIIPG
jgi:hypothetical protein